MYRSSDVVLGHNAKLEANVIIGSGCKVGENARLRDSVIGENCLIGKNAVLGRCGDLLLLLLSFVFRMLLFVGIVIVSVRVVF